VSDHAETAPTDAARGSPSAEGLEPRFSHPDEREAFPGLAAKLERLRVGLRRLTESIDTSTPGGKLIFHVFGALAEFERDLIGERTAGGASVKQVQTVLGHSSA